MKDQYYITATCFCHYCEGDSETDFEGAFEVFKTKNGNWLASEEGKGRPSVTGLCSN